MHYSKQMEEPAAASPSEESWLLRLAPDVALQLYAFLPVADLLAFSRASRAAVEHVWEQQHHWQDLTRRLLPDSAQLDQLEPPGGLSVSVSASSGSAEQKWDGKEAFVRMAEAELQWRKGQPVAVRERRLAIGKAGVSQARLQSMALWRPRGLLLVAVGEELGVFDAAEDEAGLELHDDEEEAGASDVAEAEAEAPLRAPMARLLAHEGSKITAVRTTPFGVVTAGMDGRVKVLDWEGFGVTEDLNHHASAVWGLDAGHGSSGPPTIAASCFRRITVSDLRQPPLHRPSVSFQGHATWVRTLHLEMDRWEGHVCGCMSGCWMVGGGPMEPSISLT